MQHLQAGTTLQGDKYRIKSMIGNYGVAYEQHNSPKGTADPRRGLRSAYPRLCSDRLSALLYYEI